MKARNLLLTLAAVVCCSSVAMALDPIGPAEASNGQGVWGWGIEYSYSEMDLIRRQPGGGTDAFDVEMNRIYLNLSRGLTDNIDVFVRIGLSDFEYTREGGSYKWEGEDSSGLVIGAGIKATFYENGNLKVGGVAQFSHSENDGQRNEKGDSSDGEGFETELTQFQITVGPTYQVTETVAVFAGPFLHFVDGEHKAYDSSYVGYRDIREDSSFGGRIGAKIDLSADSTLSIEYMDTGDAWGAACMFSMPI